MKDKKNIQVKLKQITSKTPSNWLDEVLWQEQNEDWLSVSQDIAINVLNALKNRNMSQKELADILKVTPQQISKIVKGRENLTIETICKLESALDIQFISNKHTLIYKEAFEELSFNFEKHLKWLMNFTDQISKRDTQAKESEPKYEKSEGETKVIPFNCNSITEPEATSKVA
ncbi:MAG TPA: helix-turn-helix domain-containing protein [Bacteroidia bacterium]|nr:helix-turn-helix domain-containing protein [Bacteroidia bacterium]